jgi:Cdc6-like AAA superfamily ATPase
MQFAHSCSELSKSIESRVCSLQENNNAIEEGVGAIRQDINRQKHYLIMNWLSSANFIARQIDLIAARQADTGMWFLESPEFTKWLQGLGKTLFCHGIPGAGKTMMAAIAVDYLHDNVETPDVGVAYLFCDYRRQADQNITNLLAAILKQLIQDRSSIAQPLSSLYDHHQPRGTRLSLAETLSTLRSVLAHFSKVYIVIDALDECSNEYGTRSQLLKFCCGFGDQTDVHIMATSRYNPEIADELKANIRLEVRASNADMKKYVLGKVNKLAKCVQRDSDLQKFVQNKIVEAADGM